MFSQTDIEQITAHGISPQSAQRQRKVVSEQGQAMEIVKPALPNDGMFVCKQMEIDNLLANYKKNVSGKKIVKFVPASGAATRMFKDLFEAWNLLKENPKQEISDTAKVFFAHLQEFAFFDTLAEKMETQGQNLQQAIENENYTVILEYLLTEKGLNYAELPKALLFFHKYDDKKRTALEEHLMEAADYADNTAYLHFTVSQEHKVFFEDLYKNVISTYEKLYGISYDIGFSTQDASTDTIAFTQDNQPFRDKNGNLLFRPGGHGSLIDNLNNIDADIVLIKNIDNVCLDDYKSDTFTYKKVLLSLLSKLQKRVFEYLKLLDKQEINANKLHEIEEFLQENFFISLPKSYQNISIKEKQDFIYQILNRPIRVCGMVKRENEPGGGPFWIQEAKGNLSLQIVETSEMNLSDSKQQQILDKSQFFNPVDLACSLKNHEGKKFELHKYIDHSRYFVSEKSHEGKVLKAIENPGLWNGAMSDWLSVFIAVPLSTFTPIKTVNDFLRKEHSRG